MTALGVTTHWHEDIQDVLDDDLLFTTPNVFEKIVNHQNRFLPYQFIVRLVVTRQMRPKLLELNNSDLGERWSTNLPEPLPLIMVRCYDIVPKQQKCSV